MIDFPYAARFGSVQSRDANQRLLASRQPAFSRHASALGALLCSDDPGSGDQLELLILGPQAQPSRDRVRWQARKQSRKHDSALRREVETRVNDDLLSSRTHKSLAAVLVLDQVVDPANVVLIMK